MTTLDRETTRAPSGVVLRDAARRPLRAGDRWVRVPLGLLYLGFLVLLTVPVAAAMTLLYYAARGVSAVRRVSRSGPERDPRSITG